MIINKLKSTYFLQVASKEWKYCDVCHQVSEIKILKNNKRNYLPDELLTKEFLELCLQCCNYLSSLKRKNPPNAYWNVTKNLENCEQG